MIAVLCALCPRLLGIVFDFSSARHSAGNRHSSHTGETFSNTPLTAFGVHDTYEQCA